MNRCFFGGRLLVWEGSIVNLVMPEEVPDVAGAFDQIDEKEFRERYIRLPPVGFPRETSAKVEDYLYDLNIRMVKLKEFYQRAAQGGLAVMFYTDDPLGYFFKGTFSTS